MKNNYLGYVFALIAVIIWSGNFVAARFLTQLSPIEISFYRWFIAFIVLTPFCIKSLIKSWNLLKGLWFEIIVTALLGVTLFNTLIYFAAHTANATNMSLLATLSPVIIALINRFVYKIKLSSYKKIGMFIVILGVVILISKGSLNTIINLQFSVGELYMLCSVILFALYTIMLKIKPKEISQSTFFYLLVAIGVIPFIVAMIFKYSNNQLSSIDFKSGLVLLYLGIFPSALGFIFWNKAIEKIGAINGTIINNSIPFFSSIEAVILLNEKILVSQVVGGIFIIIGIIYSSVGDKFFKKSV